MRQLSQRQKLFAENIVKGMSHTAAAIAAGYSKKSAGFNADKLLKNTKIREYMEKLNEPREKEVGLTIEQIKSELSKIAQCEEALPCDRMKAMDLLCKIQGIYNKESYEIKKAELELKKAEFELRKKAAEENSGW